MLKKIKEFFLGLRKKLKKSITHLLSLEVEYVCKEFISEIKEMDMKDIVDLLTAICLLISTIIVLVVLVCIVNLL